MLNYLLETEDFVSLEKEQNSIIKKNQFEDSSISIYDLEETLLENALEDMDTYNFLSSKKTIIIRNLQTIKQEENKKDIDHFLKYFENPREDILLIIEEKKLNNTYKITKELKKKCKYQKIEIEPKEIIKEELKDYKIKPDAIHLLEEYTLKDITRLKSECEKLKNYKYDEKEITKKDIEELVVKKLGDSKDLTFSFTRSLAEKNKKEALRKYRELLSYDLEPLSILGLLGSQIRIIYQVKLLEKKKMSDKEIANFLGEKSDYRITKTRELTRYYTNEELLEYMIKLSEIDYQIKTEDVDGNNLIEMFIINQ